MFGHSTARQTGRTYSGLETTITLAAVALGILLLPGTGAMAQSAEAPPLIAENTAEVAVEAQIISDADVERYREIFELQKDGKWKAADREIAKLENRVLMGHVLYQRYMHPTKYRSKFEELRDWLAVYSDHPDADKIYTLAMRRKPARAPAPREPEPRKWVNPPAPPVPPGPRPSDDEIEQTRLERSLRSKITEHLGRGGNLERAEKYIWASEHAGVFDRVTFDTHLSRLASRYYYRGDIDKALALSEIAVAESADQLPEASWIAGLAAWRLGNWALAAKHFEDVPAAKEEISELSSAGAFWASRAYLRMQQPEKVLPLLEKAAEYPRTFYGILAARQLGVKPRYDWSLPPLSVADLEEAKARPGIARAIALNQVGNPTMADEEFNMAIRRAPPGFNPVSLKVATHVGLTSAQVSLARQGLREGFKVADASLFPLPQYEPEDGFKLDRTLLYAFMRQESNFLPGAKSWAGARGLMQLMPATAGYIHRDNSLRNRNIDKLFDPGFNMMLGQKYLLYLFDKSTTQGNLILVAAAYNAGPGNVSKWLNRIEHNGDWLLFMESIPVFETRHYVERVVENLWVYEARFNQPSPSLDAIASGSFPSYSAMGPRSASNQ